MNYPKIRLLGVIACGILLAMSIAMGGTAWAMSGAIADGSYDPIRDDRATAEEAVAIAERLPKIEGASAVIGVVSSVGLYLLLRHRPSDPATQL
jgi:hypothetical protein